MSKHFRRTIVQIAVDALNRADTEEELAATWDEYCDHYAPGSRERTDLQRVYDHRLKRVRLAESAASLLRV